MDINNAVREFQKLKVVTIEGLVGLLESSVITSLRYGNPQMNNTCSIAMARTLKICCDYPSLPSTKNPPDLQSTLAFGL